MYEHYFKSLSPPTFDYFNSSDDVVNIDAIHKTTAAKLSDNIHI